MESGRNGLRYAVCVISVSSVRLTRLYAQLVAGQALWAKLFYLIRTGHADEALNEAIMDQAAVEHKEPGFVSHLRAWSQSPDRK